DGGLVLDRLRADAPSITIGMAVLILGAYTVFRRPEHGAARALLLFGAGLTAYNVVGWLSIDVAHVVAAPWLFILGIEATTALLSVWVTAAALLALSFPTPPMALERRPWLTKAVFAVLLAATVGVQTVYLASGRATLEGLDGLYGLNEACLYGLSGLALAGVIRTIVRSRRDPSTRRQGALVALGMGTTVALLVSANLFLGQEWPAWFEVVAWLPLPTALAVALVRGEFLDIRATVNRALVFASLTTILLALYVAAVAAIGGVVGRSGLAQTLPATGLVAVAFAPVRARVQRAVERLLYGERGDPSRVLGALGRRLETAVPPDHLLPAIAETVANALRLPYVGIKTTSGEAARLACERGERPEHPESLPLVHQGRSVGELLVGLRRGERSLSDSDRSLLGAIAPQVASAVNATGLLTEIAASRSRLAVAREEERARLRHDLHDRLGPHLVGLGLQLDTLEGRVQDSDVVDVIRKAHNEAESALNEVRRISRGLRPAELDELGLVAAIDAAAARLTVGDDDHAWRASVAAAVQLPAIPAATEAAAYHIAVEALTNAHRHSGGGHAEVHIGVDASGASLTVEISDDGRGMNGKAGEGVGIRSMTERAAGVGGALELCDRPAGGTVVRADLPLSR
ncbi:MAG TPA: histidine kinase, partial [Acidimicrobiales bacterium]